MRTSLIKKSYRLFGSHAKPGLVDQENEEYNDFKLNHLANRLDDNISDTKLKSLFNTNITEKDFISKFGYAKHESNSPYHEIPKISDNSINLYRASSQYNMYRFIRFMEGPTFAYGLLFFNFPVAFIACAGFAYVFGFNVFQIGLFF